MRRVLVVEDHPDTQSLLCDLLELEGFDARCHGSAEGVIPLAHSLQPDIILLDVVLPGISGLELLKLLDRDPEMRSVPVLMCSGAIDQLDAHRAELEQSGAQVVTKPFGLDRLDAVNLALEKGPRNPLVSTPSGSSGT